MIEGLVEYTGPQRCGKSTLMMFHALTRIIPENHPSRIFSNFHTIFSDITPLCSDDLMHLIIDIKHKKLSNILILFDEMSQYLSGRGYTKSFQTDIVSFAWQMPKRRIVLLYTSNVGNSVDIIMRDATWITCIPNYQCPDGIPQNATIPFTVSLNYERGIDEREAHGIYAIQQTFDTREPIE